MRYDREAADKLRSELGITTEARAGAPHGLTIGTAAEYRALREVLRLTLRQFSARFKVPIGTLHYWGCRPGTADIHVKPALAEDLGRALERARELGLLRGDPRADKPARKSPVRDGTVVAWRCSGCGAKLRRKEVRRLLPDGNTIPLVGEAALGEIELVHGTPSCGPVQFEDRRENRSASQARP